MVMAAASALLHEPEEESENGTEPQRKGKVKRPPKPFKEMTEHEYMAWCQANGI